MTIKLNPLPFSQDALQPYMSEETVYYHYEKHHRSYVDKLNKALDDSQKNKSLEQITLDSTGAVFNSAAQVWNHDFFWRSLAPDQSSPDDSTFMSLLNNSFSNMDDFKQQFKEAALGRFGSGWAWLVYNPEQHLMEIVTTPNAETPLTTSAVPLLTLDVWEHAYYIDYRNERAGYVDDFLSQLINWSFAVDNLHQALDTGEQRRYA